MSGLCTAQFWPRYCWHLTPPMVISHHKSGRTSLIRISRPLLNHHSPKKAWLLKYQCQDLSDKEGWATAGNIYTTSNRPETGKKRGQQWRQHQFHFLPSFSTCQVTWPPQGEEIVSDDDAILPSFRSHFRPKMACTWLLPAALSDVWFLDKYNIYHMLRFISLSI